MLNLTRAIDRATGYVFVPPTGSKAPPGAIDETSATPSSRPNTFALFSSAASNIKGTRSDVRDVQERWIDAQEEWDAFEKKQWRKEGELLREEAARMNRVRERKEPSDSEVMDTS
jgi:GPN-loop GTPase